jgi:hypothetical protein
MHGLFFSSAHLLDARLLNACLLDTRLLEARFLKSPLPSPQTPVEADPHI